MSGEVLASATHGAMDYEGSLPIRELGRDPRTGLPLSAQAAFFNDFPSVRENSLKELRASSPFSPDMWNALDEATGVKRQQKVELTADSTLTVDSWAEYSEMILSDQFVESTLVDQLIAAGFGVSSTLSRYAHFNQVRNVRLEAATGMNIRSNSTQDMPAYGLDGIPLPLDVVTYEIDAREFQNAMAHGESFDSSVGTEARRALNRAEGRRLFDGWGGQIQTERGLLTLEGLDSDAGPILQASGSTGWNNDPDEILADVDDMHDSVEDQTDVEDTDDVPLVSEVGAWWVVPRGKWGEVNRQDYETEATDEPLIDRIERKYPYLNIVPAKYLDDDTTLFVLNDPRYFQLVSAQDVTSTTWDVDGGAGLRARLLASRNPFLRIQPDGISGIVRKTGIDA